MASIGRVFRDTLVYGSGDALLRATAFLTLPIYTRLFAPGEYGLWSYVVTLTFLLYSALLLGGDSAYTRFFFATQDARERQVLTSTVLLLVGVVSTVAALVLAAFSAPLSSWMFGTDDRALLLALAVLAAPFVVANTIAGTALRNQFRPALFAVLNGVTALLGVAISLYFIVVRDAGVEGAVGGVLAAAAVMLPVRLWTIRGLLVRDVSSPVLRKVLRFGLPLVPAAIAGWVFSLSDRIVLGQLSSLHELGLYAVAASITGILTFLYAPFGAAWGPRAIQTYERDQAEASVFFGQVLTYILLVFGFLAVAVAAFADDFVRLLTPGDFSAASSAVPPLALGAVAYATIQVTALGLTLRHRTVYIALVSTAAAVLNLGLNLAFVPAYGQQASAWATAVTSLALTVAYLVLSRRLFRVRYESRRGLAIAAATVAFALAATLLPSDPLALSLVVKGLYCAAFVGVLFVLGAVDRRETVAVRGALRGFREPASPR
jgi:O-antigen/teichoic acid export membrane protein